MGIEGRDFMVAKVYVTNITSDTIQDAGRGVFLHHVVCDCTVEGGVTEKQVYRIFNEREYADVISKGHYLVPFLEDGEKEN